MKFGKLRFQCEFCSRVCDNSNRLMVHRRIHTGERPFCCQYCPKTFAQQGHLFNHTKTHTGDKPHKCRFCDYAAIQKQHLRNHEKIHQGPKPFVCQFCNYCTKHKGYLERHEQRHGEKKSSSKGSVQLKSSFLKIRFKGPLSRKKNRDPAQKAPISIINVVPKVRKPKLQPDPSESPKKFKCQICSKRSRTKQGLRLHLLSHKVNNKYRCQNCRKAFPELARLLVHRRIHTGERPYRCQFCHKGFSQKPHLIVHVRTHTGEKPYKCRFCSHSATQRGHMNIHERTHVNAKSVLRTLASTRAHAKRIPVVVNSRTVIPQRPNAKRIPAAVNSKKISPKSSDDTKKQFKCGWCDFVSAFNFSTKRHEQTYHSNPPLIPTAKKPSSSHSFQKDLHKLDCDAVSCLIKKTGHGPRKLTPSNDKLIVKSETEVVLPHREKAHQPFYSYSICKICKFVTNTESEIISHVNAIHNLPRVAIAKEND